MAKASIPPGARSKLIKAVTHVIKLADGKYVVKVVKKTASSAKKKSNRLRYLGKTPGKNSRTGREVIERMQGKKQIVGVEPDLELVWKDPDSELVEYIPLEDCDMGHFPEDAVDWWNRVGYKFGPKSKEAREFMLDSENYELQPRAWNQLQGAKTTSRYRAPGPV